MIVNSARFVTSSPTVEKAPDTALHEYAFIGRSNVGKSSLINMLTGRKGLAMTSSKPGKTMLINHFLVNDKWYIVDLPGYGYAQRSKKDLAAIDAMIRGYILQRPQMTNLFLLIDSRLEPQKIDLQFMEWLGENGVPFSIVFTKADKQSKAATSRNVAKFCEKMLEQWEELPPVFVSSSEDRRGRDEILDYIDQLNRLPLLSDNTQNTNAMNKENTTPAVDTLPGATLDASDAAVTPQEEAQDTATLDSNPASNPLFNAPE